MERDNYTTVYMKDYCPKATKRLKLYGCTQEFQNPMGESFREFLKLTKDEELKPREEYADDYLNNTVRVKYPEIYDFHFREPFNHRLVEAGLNRRKHTIYQSDYCDMDKQYEKTMKNEELAKNIKLPDDWNLPATTYGISYRNPTLLKANAFIKVPPIIPERSQLGMSKNMQDILHIKTGLSEYRAVISELGRVIIEDEIHGKIVHPPCGCAKHKKSGDES